MRISNTGETDILQSHFDQTEPWGLQVVRGRLIEVRLISSTSTYLESNVKPEIKAPRDPVGSFVELQKVILERGKTLRSRCSFSMIRR